MVSKIKNLFSKASTGIHEAALLIAALSLFSQILGLVRDKMLAHHFGAGQTLDIYWAAFRIPDLLYTTLASILAAIVIMPFLVEKLERSHEEAHAFINSMFTIFIILCVGSSVLLFVFMPYLSPLVIPGLDATHMREFVMLSRTLLLSPLILGISNLLGSITQVYKKFFAFSLAPVLYNLGIIFGIIFLLPQFGLEGIVYGVILGALAHMSIQLPIAFSHQLAPRLTAKIDWKTIQKVIMLSLPRVLTLTFTQISITGYVAIASFFATGSIAVFTLAYNLQSVPLTLIGVSYSVAAFPILSELYVAKNFTAFEGYILSATRHIIFWSLPIICAFTVLRAHIVRILFGSGAFSWTDTRLTAAVLAIFVVSLLAQSITLLLLRASYAAKETRIPLVTQGIATIGGLLLLFGALPRLGKFPFMTYFLEALFRVTDVSGTSVLLLPLFFSASSILGMIFLWYVLYKKGIAPHVHPLRRVFFESFSASLIAAFATYQFLAFSGTVLPIQTFWGITLQTLFGTLIGAFVWLVLLSLLQSKELREFASSIHHKFWRVQTIAPEQSEL